MEALLLVAELDGPPMFARIGIMRAINRPVERVFDSSRKDKHWGKRKLKRDVLELSAIQRSGLTATPDGCNIGQPQSLSIPFFDRPRCN